MIDIRQSELVSVIDYSVKERNYPTGLMVPRL